MAFPSFRSQPEDDPLKEALIILLAKVATVYTESFTSISSGLSA